MDIRYDFLSDGNSLVNHYTYNNNNKTQVPKFLEQQLHDQWNYQNKLTIVSSLLLQAIPIAPWATAGSISSIERIEVTCSVIFKRLRPANANNVAWTTPSFSFLKRVWTLPRKFSSTYNEDNPKQIREILKRQNWSQNAETSWEN